MKGNNPLDIQVGGDHYKSFALQPVQFSNMASLGFCEGSIIKYISRWRKKNGLEDIEKVFHFLDLLIHDLDNGTCTLPIITTAAPLERFLAQFKDITAPEASIIRVVTNWRRATGRAEAFSVRRVQELKKIRALKKDVLNTWYAYDAEIRSKLTLPTPKKVAKSKVKKVQP